MKQLLNKIKARIRSGQSLKKEVAAALEKINSTIKKQKIKAVAVVGGSFAKNTNLSGDFDIDIFVKFNYKLYKDKDISRLLGKILKQLKPVMIHGSRDYYHIKQDKENINFEVVPVLDIKKPEIAQNVTDMSPMHVEWVKNNIRKNKKLVDEIRLAKQFCKAQNCYGAESYIKGFSGHVLDILTIYYGSFEKLLKAAPGWKEKTVIDFYNFHKGNALFNLNASKIHSPIIVIDPILPDRNAAAALSSEKLNIFIDTAKKFLKNPAEGFFEKKDIDESALKKKSKNNKLMILKISCKKGKKDVVGSRLLKAFEYIKKSIQKNDFSLIESGWSWNKKANAMFYYICKKETLSKKKIVKGPPKKQKFHSKNFMKKHKKTFIKNGWLYAEVKRKYIKVENLVNALIKEPYVTEKVKEIK